MVDQIGKAQIDDACLKRMKEKVEIGANTQFIIREYSMLVIGNHVCVPDFREVRKQIMEEAYTASYAMHHGSMKMYRDLESFY